MHSPGTSGLVHPDTDVRLRGFHSLLFGCPQPTPKADGTPNRFEAERLYRHSACSTAEFSVEIGAEADALALILARLEEYSWRLTSDMIRLSGADRFPASSPLLVPT
jgi:hypothetical protein